MNFNKVCWSFPAGSTRITTKCPPSSLMSLFSQEMEERGNTVTTSEYNPNTWVIYCPWQDYYAGVAIRLEVTLANLVGCVKICLTSSLITVQNLVVVSHTVCTHAGGPKRGPYQKILGYWGHVPLGWGHGWHCRNTLMTYVLRTKFRGSGSSHLDIRRSRSLKKFLGCWGPSLWMGWMTPYNHLIIGCGNILAKHEYDANISSHLDVDL